MAGAYTAERGVVFVGFSREARVVPVVQYAVYLPPSPYEHNIADRNITMYEPCLVRLLNTCNNAKDM